MAPSQSVCLLTDLAGTLGRGMQSVGELFPSTKEHWEEEGRGGKRCLGRKQECVGCKKDCRPGQELNGNYSIVFPLLRWEIMGRFTFTLSQ